MSATRFSRIAGWLGRAASWRGTRSAAAQAPCARALARMDPAAVVALLSADQSEAAPWVRDAARQGIVPAQVRLGRMLLAGEGLPRDPDAARRWFATAAREGDVDGMNMLGRCHENGWGTVVDMEKAASWYRKAAERGDSWAQYNLGHLLLDGNGVARDHEAAFAWYSRAVAQGHPRAMNLAARCLEHGWGTAKDFRQAAELYRRSAEAGYFRGQYNYATLLLRAGRKQDAHNWLLQAMRGSPTSLTEKMQALQSKTHGYVEPETGSAS